MNSIIIHSNKNFHLLVNALTDLKHVLNLKGFHIILTQQTNYETAYNLWNLILDL